MGMKMRSGLVLVLCGVTLSALAFSRTPPPMSHEELGALRDKGQTGVDELWARRPSGTVPEFEHALDTVCAQKDCSLSRLYWYTDLEKATAEAKRTHKPILSLRLLGRLDEELSCANSRFFRTTLYSDPELGDYLRTHFVLHWASERPVPKVTIDFGDGRQMKTTITGNSVHYVLDENGRLVDALPGLYGARRFQHELEEAAREASAMGALDATAWRTRLAEYHRTRASRTADQWAGALKKAGVPERPLPVLASPWPSSFLAMQMAVTKAVIERPQLRRLEVPDRDLEQSFEKTVDDPIWSTLGHGSLEEVSLPQAVLSSLEERGYLTPDAGEVAALRTSIATDTVRNELLLRPVIDRWLATPITSAELQAFNKDVYANLFLTPADDPWVGLYSERTFTGLRRGGLVQP